MPWPVFVISLKDAHERREAFRRQSSQYNIQIDIIDAVDGRNGLAPELKHKIDRAAAYELLGHEMSDGEFACALSHQSIYERIIQEKLPGAIVLEDDALLSHEFAAFLTGRKYEDADFIQMDYLGARYHPWKTRRFFTNVRIVRSARNACLASGYSLSAKAAAYILSQSRPLKGLADWPCDLQPIKPMITLPRIVRQPPADPSQSSLEEDRKTLRQLARNQRKKGERLKRFGRKNYWYQWCLKRLTCETPWN